MKSMFVVIEGLEGAGKTTAREQVKSIFLEFGVEPSDIKDVREPGGTPLSETLRNIIKDDRDDETLVDVSELMLFYVARTQLVVNVIQPHLRAGCIVIGDRHDWSTIAYQGGGRGVPKEKISLLKSIAIDDFEPDLYIFMDVDPVVGLERARGRGALDRIEKMDLSFFIRARESFLELVKENPRKSITVDANGSLDAVSSELKIKLREFLKHV
ncbi:dTMP kinase [Photobacterium kishitanii]|uniref:Thymidylate kinase n=1 Tax=Photobacterium kishitanii TaxID=318456 RepID=A0A2T3KMA1_9GAMM|nr:dTMP kinase [Photobacterium kishitanii]PSV00926.1 dTMP kinase [Photobacterium kishitanii]